MSEIGSLSNHVHQDLELGGICVTRSYRRRVAIISLEVPLNMIISPREFLKRIHHDHRRLTTLR